MQFSGILSRLAPLAYLLSQAAESSPWLETRISIRPSFHALNLHVATSDTHA